MVTAVSAFDVDPPVRLLGRRLSTLKRHTLPRSRRPEAAVRTCTAALEREGVFQETNSMRACSTESSATMTAGAAAACCPIPGSGHAVSRALRLPYGLSLFAIAPES